MDIADFSDKTAELFYDLLDVREPAQLCVTMEQLLTLPGFKQKKAANLINALNASKACTLDAFLLAVGIPNIGRVTARDLALRLGTLDGVRNASVETLRDIVAIGDIVAAGIREFFEDPRTAAIIDNLLTAGVAPHQPDAASEGAALSGKPSWSPASCPPVCASRRRT